MKKVTLYKNLWDSKKIVSWAGSQNFKPLLIKQLWPKCELWTWSIFANIDSDSRQILEMKFLALGSRWTLSNLPRVCKGDSRICGNFRDTGWSSCAKSFPQSFLPFCKPETFPGQNTEKNLSQMNKQKARKSKTFFRHSSTLTMCVCLPSTPIKFKKQIMMHSFLKN